MHFYLISHIFSYFLSYISYFLILPHIISYFFSHFSIFSHITPFSYSLSVSLLSLSLITQYYDLFSNVVRYGIGAFSNLFVLATVWMNLDLLLVIFLSSTNQSLNFSCLSAFLAKFVHNFSLLFASFSILKYLQLSVYENFFPYMIWIAIF